MSGTPSADSPRFASGGKPDRYRVISVVLLVLAIALVTTGVALLTYGPSVRGGAPAPLPPARPVVDAKQPEITPPRPVPSNTLSIPSLEITTPLVVEPVVYHSLQIPGDVHIVGLWDGGGQLDGTSGTVLLAGHVNHAGQGEGALWNLAGIHINAPVYTSGPSGQLTTWKVDQVIAVPKDRLPQSIFTATGQRRLVIVTCGGTLLSDGHYADNVIVLATPVVQSDASSA